MVAVLHDLNHALRYADDVLLLARGEPARLGPAAAEVLTADCTERTWGVACTPVRSDRGSCSIPGF